jgi:hypothetical protein
MKYCCGMRRYFRFGITGVSKTEQAPTEIVDFVTQWEPKIVVRIKHCPFCGEVIPPDADVRITNPDGSIDQ